MCCRSITDLMNIRFFQAMIAWIALIDWLSIPVNASCVTCVGGEKVRERNWRVIGTPIS